MTNLDNQPFIVSLKQAANHLCCSKCRQTFSCKDYEALLKEQQRDFKELIERRFFIDLTSPHKCFYFLKTAKDVLYRIHLNHSDAVRESDLVFYRYWATIIDETRRFIKIGIDTLRFQRKLPAHMASAAVSAL